MLISLHFSPYTMCISILSLFYIPFPTIPHFLKYICIFLFIYLFLRFNIQYFSAVPKLCLLFNHKNCILVHPSVLRWDTFATYLMLCYFILNYFYFHCLRIMQQSLCFKVMMRSSIEIFFFFLLCVIMKFTGKEGGLSIGQNEIIEPSDCSLNAYTFENHRKRNCFVNFLDFCAYLHIK